MLSLRLFLLYCSLVFLVINADDTKDAKDKDATASSAEVKIVYLNVQSRIQTRFATTWITSKVSNLGKTAKEVSFTAQLPDEAFISNFSMLIGDKLIYGDVKEKEEAKAAFQAAKERGESAGHISQKPRETNAFQIQVNVAAESKVTFNLTYQEILKRVHGVYKHIINLQPEQAVDQMSVEVDVIERGEITNVKVPKFGPKVGEKTNKELLTEEDEKDAQVKMNVTKKVSNVRVVFEPKKKNADDVVSGQLVLLYDVRRDLSGGDIEVVDGYFVHFFAPEGLPKGNKHAVFVLDKSGSMSGRKFKQLKEAMKVILNDLNAEDLFNIIFFSSEIERWKTESVKATPDNVKAAQLYVADTEPSGGTNIYDSLKEGLKILDSSKSDNLVSMILFLTDGQPTEGETNRTLIWKDMTTLNSKKNIINSIGFGGDADLALMKTISAKNRGLAKKIYEDSDAALQLKGFYDEISTPLLTEVKINYLNETVDVDSLVQDQTHNYFDGDELAVIGKLRVDAPIDADVHASVVATGKSGQVKLKAVSSPWICPRWGWGCCPRPILFDAGHAHDIIVPRCCFLDDCHIFPLTTPKPELLPANQLGGFIERMWAYQSIKKLLKENEIDGGNNEKSKKRALDLSLKYHFVTALTSMVVIQPNETNATTLKQDMDDKKRIEEESGNIFPATGGFFGANGGRSRNLHVGGLAGAPGPLDFQAAKLAPSADQFKQPPPPAPAPPPPPQTVGPTSSGDTKDSNKKEDKTDSSSSSSSSSESDESKSKPVSGESEKKPEKPVEKKECHMNLLIVMSNSIDDTVTPWMQKFTETLIDTVHSKKHQTTKFLVVKESTLSPFMQSVTIDPKGPQLGTAKPPGQPIEQKASTEGVTNEKTEVQKSSKFHVVYESNLTEAATDFFFNETNESNKTNVVIFLANGDLPRNATKSGSQLIARGARVFVVSATKINEKQKKDLLKISGDFANLFETPSADVVSNRLSCQNLYVWRANF